MASKFDVRLKIYREKKDKIDVVEYQQSCLKKRS